MRVPQIMKPDRRDATPSRIARATVAVHSAAEPLGVTVLSVQVTEDQRVIAGQRERQRAPVPLPGPQDRHRGGVEVNDPRAAWSW